MELASWTLLWTAIWTAVVVASVTVAGGHLTIVLSGSMEPALSPGDLLVGRDDVDHPVAAGEVVTFVDGQDRMVTHRVVEVGDGAYRTRGDANGSADRAEVVFTAVRSRGRVVVPLVGMPALWARTGDLPRLGGWLVALGAAVMVAAGPRGRPNGGSDGE